MVFILSLLAIFTISTSHAATPAVCNDLHALTCSDTPRSDLTGAAKTLFPDTFTVQELIRIRPKVTAEFRRMFDAGQSEGLKQGIVDALPEEDRSICNTLFTSPECNQIASEALGNLYYLTEDPPADEAPQLFEASASLAILQREDYRAVASKITAENVPPVDKALADKVKNELFPTAKAMLLKKVQALSVDAATKQKLVRKINRAKFLGVNCPPEKEGSTGLLQSLKPNAEYNEANGEVRICPSQIRFTSSEFDLIATLAHEIAHSIDPCFLSRDLVSPAVRAKRLSDEDVADQYLSKGFIYCLRSPESISAGKVPLKLGESLTKHMKNSPTRFCEKDQINEAVADWFAAEVVAEYAETKSKQLNPKFTADNFVAGFSNIARQQCQKHSQLAEHPLTIDRINSIILVQPKIRSLMGCPPNNLLGKKYCDINSSPPSRVTSPTTAERVRSVR